MSTEIKHLNIEVTKKCNQRCFYCFNDSGKGSSATELTLRQWLNILHEMQRKGLQSIHLTGGEPFAYKDAVGLLGGAQAMALSTSILSNGYRIKGLVEDFPDVFGRLTVAQISLDSMNEETHNHRRGYPRAWKDAVSAIRALRQIAVPVEVSCVVSETNLADLREIAEFCYEVKADLIIRPIIATGRAAAQKIPDSFARDLELCVKSLTESQTVHLVADRFHYVVDEREIQQPQWTSDLQTVYHNGRLRSKNIDNINLIALAA